VFFVAGAAGDAHHRGMGQRAFRGAVIAAALAACVGAAGCGGVKVRAVSKVSAKLPLKVHRHTLSNGLEVLLQEDHHTPYVAIDVSYRVGGRDDPPGRSGLAHVVEHLTFNGTKHVPKGQFFTLLNKAGALDENGHTTHDHTDYHEVVPEKDLELALWLESDRMGFFLEGIQEKAFAVEREIVKNERRQHYENEAYGEVHSLVSAAIFPEDHPYHHSVIGTMADLNAITLDDAKRFFSRYYVPDNATLTLVGDFDEKAALALVTKYFEPIPKGPAPIPAWPKMPVTLSTEKTIEIEAGVEAPQIVYGWPLPPIYSPEYYDLVAAAAFFGGNMASELTSGDAELTDSIKIAHRASAYYHADELAGWLDLTVTLHPGGDIVAGKAAIDEVVDHLGRYTRWEKNSVIRTGTANAAALAFDLEDMGERARLFSWYAQLTGTPEYPATVFGGFDTLDPEDARVAWRDLILRTPSVIAFVRPVKGAPRGGRLK
jgi:predicted Zn-dependent peptidase